MKVWKAVSGLSHDTERKELHGGLPLNGEGGRSGRVMPGCCPDGDMQSGSSDRQRSSLFLLIGNLRDDIVSSGKLPIPLFYERESGMRTTNGFVIA
jgi:hypothetical protein